METRGGPDGVQKSNTKSWTPQLVLRQTRRPVVQGVLLTLGQACEAYGLYAEQLYALTHAGLVHAVKPNGRILYPAWEIEQVFNSAKPGLAPVAINTVAKNGGLKTSSKIEDGSKVGKPSLVQFRRRLFKNAA